MERFDIDGLFWLVDKPEDKVAGRLRFDPVAGARLGLIGKFKNFIPSGSNPPVRMNAIAGGRFFTLEDCHFERVTKEYAGGGQSGLTRHEYQSDLLLAGLHWDNREPLQFKNVLLHVRYLEQWVHALSSKPIGYEDRVNALPRISHKFDAFERSATVGANFGELGLSYGEVKYGDDFLEAVRRRNCYFDLRLMEPRPFEKILSLCWVLQDLVTLGCDYPSAVTGVTFEHAQQSGETTDEKKHPITPYMRATGHYGSGSYDDVNVGKALFTFNDIGGITGVFEWLKVASRYGLAIGSLTHNLYSPNPYSENSFFNACTAAETMRRIQLGQQNLNLSKELPELADHAGDMFKDLIGDVSKWAEKVVRVRINSVVHPGLRGTDALAASVLADSLHLLVVLCLLEECGVREQASERVQFSDRAYRLRRDLPTVL